MTDNREEEDKSIQSVSRGERERRRCPKCNLEVPLTALVCPQDGAAIVEEPVMELSKTYEFISVTGFGGMSIIYKARERKSRRIVAIKMLHTFVVNAPALRRFEQEAQAIRSLRHPNIINVYDFGLSDHGQPYMVMDYIEGKNLGELIQERGDLSVEESLPRFIQICDAFQHAHSRGILHRDIKPSNIMLASDDGSFEDARIVDFGIAKLMDKEADAGTLTRTGELFGSPLYMSPEQCRAQAIDERSDIYSMGCVMYEAMTGRPPLRGSTIVETLIMHLNQPPLLLSQARPDKQFPQGLEAAIDKALAKDPAQRFQTMNQLKMDLMQINPQNLAEPVRMRTPTKPPQLKGMRYIAAVGAISFFLGAGVAVLVMPKTQDSTPGVSAPPEVAANLDLFSERTSADGMLDSGINAKVSKFLGDPWTQAHRSELFFNAKLMLNDSGTENLQHMKLLRALFLDNTMITDVTLGYIEKLTTLRQLSLSGTMIDDAGVSHLGRLQNLYQLDLSHSDITDASMPTVSGFHSLTELSLEDTALSDSGLEQLKHLKLKKLLLGHTDITDKGLSALENMTTLQVLDINDCNITDAGLAKLNNLTNLIDVSVADTKISDRGLENLASMKKLMALRAGSAGVTDAAVPIFHTLPHLLTLDLTGASITDNAVPQIAALKNLTRLSLGHTKITDAALKHLAEMSLLELYLDGTAITDEGIKVLGKMHGLKRLGLGECKGIRGSNNQLRQDLATTIITSSRY